jgi:outer membrane protein assembly factor BamA
MNAVFQPQKYTERRCGGWVVPMVFLTMWGCSPLKRLPEKDRLIAKNEIQWIGVSSEEVIPKGAKSVIRQPANRRFLGMRIPLMIHGVIRQEILQEKAAERMESGKEKPGMRHWIANVLGEPPVLFDAIAKERTERNLEALSRRAGFLDARCLAIVTELNAKEVSIVYRVDAGPLYSIGEIQWDVSNSGINQAELEGERGIRTGDVFDADQLEVERSDLAQFLKSKGYASLDETYISFQADTLSNNRHVVGLTIEVRPAKYDAEGVAVQHRRSRFRDVDWTLDTLSKPIRKEVLEHLISIEPGMRYNETAIELSYRRLMQLPSIARVEIPGFMEAMEGAEDAFDVSVKLIQRPRYGVSAALDMTRTDARYGPVLTGVFSDRNVSGRGDMLELLVSAGITSSQPFSYTQTSLVPNSATWSLEAHYSTLGIPPIALSRLRASNASRTDFTGLWSRESRPEYARNSIGFKHGFQFIENPLRDSRIYVDLVELRYTNIELQPEFKQWLDNESNPFIQYRFQDYASILSRMRWASRWKRNEFSFGNINLGLEWTGWGLNALSPVLGLERNESGQYLLGRVPYVQFIRTEGTWSGTQLLDRFQGLSLHGRLRVGAGWAGQNFNVLPFDRSFFTGSANGVRGWPARQLGPGHAGYESEGLNLVKGLGDLLGEVNLELRKKSTRMLEWAFFVDAGNVWLMQESGVENPIVNPRFSWSSWGLSSGIGIRLDFDFFLFRLDGGLRVHDPGLLMGQRWIGQHNPKGSVHLGIGHPF